MSGSAAPFPTALQVVDRLYDAFTRGDIHAVTALLADNLVWNEAENFMLSDCNPYRTPAAVAEHVFGRLNAQIRGYQATPSEILDAGNVVIALGRSKGTFNATGRYFDAQYAHIWRVQDGRVVGFQQVVDTLEIWRARQGL